MMNKSLTNKVLVFIVVLVWALVIYKYWFKGSSENQFVRDYTKHNSIVSSPRKIKEVSIIPLNRDPFLNQNMFKKERKEKVAKPNVVKEKNITKKIINDVWPSIKYLGFLQKENSGKKILLLVNGKFKKVGKNERILNDIKIKKVFKDSIIIEGKKKIKTIKKGS
ncbi:hypothetical protein [Tenacibaculum xiamenense]|uniref:hypothetical protein n=1 Tax=Tenacibaculum xiamenense TaxID=1261553 RepID=UPI00389518C1